MRVLVIDDEADVRSVVARALEVDDHEVITASDLASARRELESKPDLVLLDLRLPDGFGLDLCREIRANDSLLPILLLTALSQVALRVEGLDAGADDFLPKPFAVAELRARVRALGRRGSLLRGVVFEYEDVLLDFAGRSARRLANPVAVTAKEWAILEVLAQRPGRIVSRLDLLQSVWGEASDSASGSLEVLIARLRRKLNPGLIRTLRGEGYALAERQKHGP